jgi:predicted short-subunit dehydrogenase-like oxidoreductase (DUF2520 family)
MAEKPRIAIVGAGNLGSALALALRDAGYPIDQILARTKGRSLQRARALARKTRSSAAVAAHAQIRADVVWFCVPDRDIGTAARTLASRSNWKGKIALHSSGVLTSDELSVLCERGAAVASVHPLMTFVRDSRPGLAGVPFAIEGDRKAVRMARRIVMSLRSRAYSIRKQDKPAYHAWGVFASPLLAALLAATEQVAASAGVRGKDARTRMLPILRQTISNYAARGAPGAFSGPIVRGDVDTVLRHLQVLRKFPELQEIYVSLANAALHYLPAKNKGALAKALQLMKR